MTTTETPPRLFEGAIIEHESSADVEFWAVVLGVSPTDMEQAISAVGPAVADVREHLQSSSRVVLPNHRRRLAVLQSA